MKRVAIILITLLLVSAVWVRASARTVPAEAGTRTEAATFFQLQSFRS